MPTYIGWLNYQKEKFQSKLVLAKEFGIQHLIEKYQSEIQDIDQKIDEYNQHSIH